MYYLFFDKHTDINEMYDKLILYNNELINFSKIKDNKVLQNCIVF